jgi:hypothetical protein
MKHLIKLPKSKTVWINTKSLCTWCSLCLCDMLVFGLWELESFLDDSDAKSCALQQGLFLRAAMCF